MNILVALINLRSYLHQMFEVIYNFGSFRVVVTCTAFVLIGCERNSPSPIEIKIDEHCGYSDIGNSSQSATHVVSGKETLLDVAYKYNVDPLQLAKINGIPSPYSVKEGQVLKLPDENCTSDCSSKPEYLPIDTNSMDTGKEIPNFVDDPSAKDTKKKDELDEDFEDIILGKNDPKSEKGEESKEDGLSFNDQAKTLSKPKITETVNGESTKSKKEQEKKESSKNVSKEKSKDDSEKNIKSIEKLQEAFKPVNQESAPKMVKPVDGEVISKFGDIKDGLSNDGVNIKAPVGTKVKAAEKGTVIYVGNKIEEYGNIVIVQHDNGLISSYAHLNDVNVKNGASVKSGDVVGTVGKTGDVTEPQLYFEVMKDKKPINPSKYLEK